MKTTILIGLAAVLLGACAGPRLSEAERKGLRSVSVSREVAMPAYPTVVGPAANTSGMLFGPIGMAVQMNRENEDSLLFQKHLYENRIDVKQIVRAEFLRQLESSGKLPPLVAEGGDALVTLAVESYGLGPGFSMRPINKPLRPTLRVVATATREGKTIWQKTDYITNLSDLPAYQINDYYNNPDKTRAGLEQAAKVVATGLVSDMIEQLGR